MALSSIFNGSVDSQEKCIDLLDTTIQKLLLEPYPGPWKAQLAINKTGLLLGFNSISSNGIMALIGGFNRSDFNQVTRKVYFDLKDTIISHSFANSAAGVPQGDAQLELCLLRYQAMRMALDKIRPQPLYGKLEANALAQDVVTNIDTILGEHGKLNRLFVHPYTEAFQRVYPEAQPNITQS